MISDRLEVDLSGGMGVTLASGLVSSVTGRRSKAPVGGFVQATPANQPAFATTALLGGQPCITFVAANSTFLASSVIIVPAQPMTYVIAFCKVSAGTMRLFEGNTSGAGLIVNDASVQPFGNGGVLTVPFTTTGVPIVVSTIMNGAASMTRVNGGAPITGNPGTSAFQGTILRLGSGIAGAPFFDGPMYGFRVWSRLLSHAEIQEEERRMASACRIPISKAA